MFSPVGYTALAVLWAEFLAARTCITGREPCLDCVRDQIEGVESEIIERNKPLNVDRVVDVLFSDYGSNLDHCESRFIESLRGLGIMLALSSGTVTKFEQSLDNGRSDLFVRTTALEAKRISDNPVEAGLNGVWLEKLGSRRFRPWPFAGNPRVDLQGGRKTVETLSRSFPSDRHNRYHTLPIAFERERFIIPDNPPPWAHDAIDHGFLSHVLEKFAGASLILSDEAAEVWRKRFRYLRSAEDTGSANTRSKKGPTGEKAIKALKAYQTLYPDGHVKAGASQKHVARAVENTIGEPVTYKTIKRAIDREASFGRKYLDK